MTSIYPEETAETKKIEAEPDTKPVTLNSKASRFHWAFRHVGLNKEHVFYGELLVCTNSLVIMDEYGEYIAAFPAQLYRAYRVENPDAMG